MNTLYGFFKDDSIPNICRLELWAVSFPISLISGTIWSSVYLWMWLFISIDFKKNSIGTFKRNIEYAKKEIDLNDFV